MMIFYNLATSQKIREKHIDLYFRDVLESTTLLYSKLKQNETMLISVDFLFYLLGNGSQTPYACQAGAAPLW